MTTTHRPLLSMPKLHETISRGDLEGAVRAVRSSRTVGVSMGRPKGSTKAACTKLIASAASKQTSDDDTSDTDSEAENSNAVDVELGAPPSVTKSKRHEERVGPALGEPARAEGHLWAGEGQASAIDVNGRDKQEEKSEHGCKEDIIVVEQADAPIGEAENGGTGKRR